MGVSVKQRINGVMWSGLKLQCIAVATFSSYCNIIILLLLTNSVKALNT